MLKRKQSKKVVYHVQCSHNPEHIFEKVFEIEEGSENKESKVQAYCFKCDKYVTVSVQGKVIPDQDILRKFNPK